MPIWVPLTKNKQTKLQIQKRNDTNTISPKQVAIPHGSFKMHTRLIN